MPDRTVNLELPADAAEEVLAKILLAMRNLVVDVAFVTDPAAKPVSYVIGAVRMTPDTDGPEVALGPWDDTEDRPDWAQIRWVSISDIALLHVL